MSESWFEEADYCNVGIPVEFECAGEGPLGLWKKFLSSVDRVQLPQSNSEKVREPQNLVCKVLWRAYGACGTLDSEEMVDAIDIALEGMRRDAVLDFRRTIKLYEPSDLPEPLSLWLRVESLRNPEPKDLYDLEEDPWPPTLMDPAQRCEVTAYCAGCSATRLPSVDQRRFGR